MELIWIFGVTFGLIGGLGLGEIKTKAMCKDDPAKCDIVLEKHIEETKDKK